MTPTPEAKDCAASQRVLKIYVASSWRNKYQPGVVLALKGCGHKVYDFREPLPGERGFAWAEIDPEWIKWSPSAFISALTHPIAEARFALDWNAMRWAECCVLVLPSGRSAHIEAGYFVGAGKPLFIFAPSVPEPELMYKMADGIVTGILPLIEHLSELAGPIPSPTEPASGGM